MPKDDLVYVGHMLEITEKAIEFTRGKDRPAYDRDETLRLALTHLVQTIGEIARHVSPEFRETNPRNTLASRCRNAPQGRPRLHERGRRHPLGHRDERARPARRRAKDDVAVGERNDLTLGKHCLSSAKCD